MIRRFMRCLKSTVPAIHCGNGAITGRGQPWFGTFSYYNVRWWYCDAICAHVCNCWSKTLNWRFLMVRNDLPSLVHQTCFYCCAQAEIQLWPYYSQDVALAGWGCPSCDRNAFNQIKRHKVSHALLTGDWLRNRLLLYWEKKNNLGSQTCKDLIASLQKWLRWLIVRLFGW